MEFKHLVEAAEKWCSGNPFDLIFAEEDDERRLDFYAEPGVSFYVLCPGGNDSFVSVCRALTLWSLAQDYISSCGKKTLLEVLEKVFTSFRPLLGLPDIEDDSFEHYHADMEGEPGPDHQQMGWAGDLLLCQQPAGVAGIDVTRHLTLTVRAASSWRRTATVEHKNKLEPDELWGTCSDALV
ncbi:hypothetical protein F7725_024872 [Dissostichus mawsoni]|uniref:Maturin n=1 Tax=Dissostichus mawsoni TaxID=36200 RepID=A0A7J5XB76_DISMA|nr:hypothetical protein F7725_024872 [Dissostichus mawsoni]